MRLHAGKLLHPLLLYQLVSQLPAILDLLLQEVIQGQGIMGRKETDMLLCDSQARAQAPFANAVRKGTVQFLH